MAFPGATSGVIFDAIMNRPPVPSLRLNPTLPVAFEHVVSKALEKDRKMRYQSAVDLGADLRRVKRATESTRTVVAQDSGQSSSRSSRWGMYAGGAVLALLLAAGAVWYQKHSAPHTAAVAGKPSVAVLPLQNLSTDADSTYFSDGMTDEITTKLSKIQGIDVAPRSTAAAVKASQQSAGELGRQLECVICSRERCENPAIKCASTFI